MDVTIKVIHDDGMTIDLSRPMEPGESLDWQPVHPVAYRKVMVALAAAWVPVAERMPEVGETVLVYAIYSVDKSDKQCAVATRRWDEGSVQFEGDYFTYEVTHWMALPAPPKE